MKQPAPRVFTPGTGVAPPALTGREREQAALRQCLADLLNGAAPTHDVATMGPRGSGKTVLLNWFENACRDAGRIHVLRLAPSRVRTAADLIGLLLLPRSRLGRLLAREPAAHPVAAGVADHQVAGGRVLLLDGARGAGGHAGEHHPAGELRAALLEAQAAGGGG